MGNNIRKGRLPWRKYLPGPPAFFAAAVMLVSLLLVLGMSCAASAQDSDPSEKSWDFERFDVDIVVNRDASFTVRETQVVNFRGSFSYLGRDISTLKGYFADGRTYGSVRVKDISVYDLDGEPYDRDLWEIESYDGGVNVRIDFQAEDEQRGWIIEYRMTGAIVFADEYDRLYWNAVSEYRDVPIRSSRVTVLLPAGTQIDEVDTAFYTDTESPPESLDYGRDGDLLWWYAEDIAPYTTITIDAAFPKGVVEIPWPYRSSTGIVISIISFILVLAALLSMLALWWHRGRDVGGRGSSMVRYDPPEGLKPAMLGMLMEQKPRVDDISATIVDLAIRGKLTIIEEVGGGLIRNRKYAFERQDHDESSLLPYEREIMRGLFEEGDLVSEDDLKNRFYTHLDSILQKGVKKEVLERKLFSGDPRKIRRLYYWIGIALAGLPSALIFFLSRNYDMGYTLMLVPAFILAGIIVAAVGWAMPRRSAKGSLAYEHALGFKDYLETAEEPEFERMTPEYFQANLPYAMVLGAAERWAERFSDIYTTPPDWYRGTGVGFSTVYLASSLNDFSRSLGPVLSSSPSGSGGSGGGFGGGSSGGGFGGGGSSAG